MGVLGGWIYCISRVGLHNLWNKPISIFVGDMNCLLLFFFSFFNAGFPVLLVGLHTLAKILWLYINLVIK